MSSFKKLPKDVRREIFRYLLVSDRVRQAPNAFLVEEYEFEVNLLRTNKAISKEASKILYQENAFVKIHDHFADIEKTMVNHEVPFIKLNGGFEHHVAEITVNIDPENAMMPKESRLENPVSFLLLLVDIPKYTRVLRLLDLANYMTYNFDFKLCQPLSTPSQEKLLRPFEQVRGVSLVQQVSFSGAFDPAIVKPVKQIMTSNVAWLRARAWEIHDIALSMKRVADLAFNLKKAGMAMIKYHGVLEFLKQAGATNTTSPGIDDPANKAICRIYFIVEVDTALLALTDEFFAMKGRQGFEMITTMTKTMERARDIEKKHEGTVPVAVFARFYYLLGVAELGLNRPNKAGAAFAKSFSLHTNQTIKNCYDAAKEWKNLDQAAAIVRFREIRAGIPKAPLDLPDMQTYKTPEVASEHWVMRELGYQGPIPYEDKIRGGFKVILTEKPHPDHHDEGPRPVQVGFVKREVLQEVVDYCRNEMDEPVAPGRHIVCWVGLRETEIGEEEIPDDESLDLDDAELSAYTVGPECRPQ